MNDFEEIQIDALVGEGIKVSVKGKACKEIIMIQNGNQITISDELLTFICEYPDLAANLTNVARKRDLYKR